MVAHFMAKCNQRYKLNKNVTPEVVDVLMKYHWPGNVRELENLTETRRIAKELEINQSTVVRKAAKYGIRSNNAMYA